MSNHGLTMIELRQLAVGAARSSLRASGLDPLVCEAADAHAALDDLARQASNSDLLAVRWYRAASSAQLGLFYRDWEHWRSEQRHRKQ